MITIIKAKLLLLLLIYLLTKFSNQIRVNSIKQKCLRGDKNNEPDCNENCDVDSCRSRKHIGYFLF